MFKVSSLNAVPSQRAQNTPSSPIRRLAPLASNAKSRGTKVYHLNIGQPDILSPKVYFEGLKNFHKDIISYESSKGNESLCKAWSEYYNRTLNLKTNPDNFLITMGASEALIFVFMICCDTNDEIIIFDPTYANYIGFGAISGVNLKPITCELENNFALPAKDVILREINPKTKAILLCSPNNPTGTVYTVEELQMLKAICKERNLFLIVDETYRELVYDSIKPLSILHLEDEDDRVIVIDSLSKRFSLCGARVGCLITSNEEVIRTALNLAQARLAGPTLEQFAAAYLLNNIDESFVEKIRIEFENRRNILYREISKIEGIVAHIPKGSFYSIVKLPVPDTEKFCRFLLEDFSSNGETTFIAPATGFYMKEGSGMDKVRIAYVLEEHELVRAIEIIGEGLQEFTKLMKLI